MIKWFDDLTLGMRFKNGEVSVTKEDIKRFAGKFDPQPFHLDEAAAEKTAFKGLAASGWHTAAPWRWVLPLRSDHSDGIRLRDLGVDDLRRMMPVRPGDVLHIEGEVVELTPSRTKPARDRENQMDRLQSTRRSGLYLYAHRDRTPSSHLMTLVVHRQADRAR
jgi:acyl dehydratase